MNPHEDRIAIRRTLDAFTVSYAWPQANLKNIVSLQASNVLTPKQARAALLIAAQQVIDEAEMLRNTIADLTDDWRHYDTLEIEDTEAVAD